jgi:hypothetical protein
MLETGILPSLQSGHLVRIRALRHRAGRVCRHALAVGSVTLHGAAADCRNHQGVIA